MSDPGSIKAFFQELRRRKVVRVAVVYAAVAWTMVEVSKTATELLELPGWTPRLVLMMFILGFPLAALLAWAYELTPEGLRRTDSEADAITAETRPRQASATVAAVRSAPARRQAPRPAPSFSPAEPRPSTPPDATQLRRAVLASLRHELRTPLNAVLGYSEMLIEDATPEQAPPLREIHLSGRRVLTLVDELLRPDATGEELSEGALAEIRERIRTQLPESVGRLNQEARAALATAQRTGNAAMVPDLERIAEAAGRLQTLVEFDLSSEGVPPTHPELHPTPGEAARVIASLPSRGGAGAESAPPKHGHILVVDDNEDNRDLLSRQLARQGFSVSPAVDGSDALAKLRGQDFDLVLLDVLMPGLDGIDVLTQMQRDAATAEIPVIMTSALDEIEGVVRCIEQGAVDYLTKPFDPVLLQARVSATLDLHRLRAQQRRARQELDEEVAWSERLIRSLVPAPLVERVRDGRGTLVESHEAVTVLVMTLQGLGTFAARQGAVALGAWLSEAVAAFDAIAAELPLEVHWEGGTTLVASTGTRTAEEDRTGAIADLALRLREEAAERCAGAEPARAGIGIHTGPAITGLVDDGARVSFGLWGEAPEVARELAWQCPDGQVQASPAAHAALHGGFAFEGRGMIETSGHSHMRVYGLIGRRPVPTLPEQ